ncbi:MAG: hypothetical protein HY551_07400, partial [Elusimicrobia bacterium]|nr:hypothetical protein [Elusimicrobiota bacterium]
MIDRCLKCGVVVGEEDPVCPSCHYDLSLTPQNPEPSKLPPLKKAGPSFVGIPEFMREEARPWRLPKPRLRGGRWAVVSASVGLFILSFVALRFWRGGFSALRREPAPEMTFIVSTVGDNNPKPPQTARRRTRRSASPRSDAVRKKTARDVQPVRGAVRSQAAASGVRSVEISGRGPK